MISCPMHVVRRPKAKVGTGEFSPEARTKLFKYGTKTSTGSGTGNTVSQSEPARKGN